jgi:hypothetical protein
MFRLAVDRSALVALGIFSGPQNSDADFQSYIDSFEGLDAVAARVRGPRGCFVLIVDPENPRPNALWRRRIADASSHLRSRPLVSVVTRSPLIRGVAIAINWLRPLPIELQSHESLALAAAWIASHRTDDIHGILTRLEREARAGMAGHGR